MTTEDFLKPYNIDDKQFKDDDIELFRIDVWQALQGDKKRGKAYFRSHASKLRKSTDDIRKRASYLRKSVSPDNPFASRLREEVDARKRQEDYADSLERLADLYERAGKDLPRNPKKK